MEDKIFFNSTNHQIFVDLLSMIKDFIYIIYKHMYVLCILSFFC